MAPETTSKNAEIQTGESAPAFDGAASIDSNRSLHVDLHESLDGLSTSRMHDVATQISPVVSPRQSSLAAEPGHSGIAGGNSSRAVGDYDGYSSHASVRSHAETNDEEEEGDDDDDEEEVDLDHKQQVRMRILKPQESVLPPDGRRPAAHSPSPSSRRRRPSAPRRSRSEKDPAVGAAASDEKHSRRASPSRSPSPLRIQALLHNSSGNNSSAGRHESKQRRKRAGSEQLNASSSVTMTAVHVRDHIISEQKKLDRCVDKLNKLKEYREK